MITHLTIDELNDGLPEIRRSPDNSGILNAIVIRPATDERISLPHCELSPEGGVYGDNWALGCWKLLPDGRPDPEVQVTLMNSHAIALIAQEESRWPLAGDNLYVDLDLSGENLPPGQQLSLGSVVLEITSIAHNGCKKFAQRFGPDAVRFVNSEQGKALHLRGIYAKVTQAEVVQIGDEIKKL